MKDDGRLNNFTNTGNIQDCNIKIYLRKMKEMDLKTYLDPHDCVCLTKTLSTD